VKRSASGAGSRDSFQTGAILDQDRARWRKSTQNVSEMTQELCLSSMLMVTNFNILIFS